MSKFITGIERYQRLPLTPAEEADLCDAELAARISSMPSMTTLDLTGVRHVGTLAFRAIAAHHDCATMRGLLLNDNPELNLCGTADFTAELQPGTFPLLRTLSVSSKTEIDQMPVTVTRMDDLGDESTVTDYVQVPITTAQWTRLFRAMPNLEVLLVRGRVLVHSEFFENTDTALTNELIPRPFPFTGDQYTADICTLINRHLPKLRILDLCHSIGSFFTMIFDHPMLERVTMPNFSTLLDTDNNHRVHEEEEEEQLGGESASASSMVPLRKLIDGVPLSFCSQDIVEDELYERAYDNPVRLPRNLRVVDVGCSAEHDRAGLLQSALHFVKTIDTIVLRDDKFHAGSTASASASNPTLDVADEWSSVKRFHSRLPSRLAENAEAADTWLGLDADNTAMKDELFYAMPWTSIRNVEVYDVRTPQMALTVARVLRTFSTTVEHVLLHSCGAFVDAHLAKTLARCPRLRCVLFLNTTDATTSSSADDGLAVARILASIRAKGVEMHFSGKDVHAMMRFKRSVVGSK